MTRNIPIGVFAQQNGQADTPGPGPGPGNAWTWHPDFLGTDHSLSNSDKTLNTLGNETNQAAISRQVIPANNQVYYWELEYNVAGDGNDIARIGVMEARSSAQDIVKTGFGVGDDFGWAAFSSGSFYHNATLSAGVTGITLGSGDVGMFAWNPSTGEIWFGENGIWTDDPDVDAASFTVTNFAPFYRIATQLEETGRTLTLHTDSADLVYTKPTVAALLTDIVQQDIAVVDGMNITVVSTPQKTNEFIVDRMRVYVVTEG